MGIPWDKTKKRSNRSLRIVYENHVLKLSSSSISLSNDSKLYLYGNLEYESVFIIINVYKGKKVRSKHGKCTRNKKLFQASSG